MSESERANAESEIDEELSQLRAQLDHAASILAARRASAQTIEDLARRAESLPIPSEPGVQEPLDSLQDVQEKASHCERELAEIGERGREIGTRIVGIDGALNEIATAISTESEAVRLYRSAEIARASSSAFAEVARALVADSVGPLAQQLEKRWGNLWLGSPDLLLSDSGELELRRSGVTIRYANFSGGEKTMAMILLRLLALQMTTRARFMCLDEPLEHLDPRNRRLLARLLVRASSVGPMRQVIVTTYEESIARALSSRSKASGIAQVQYVRASSDGAV